MTKHFGERILAESAQTVPVVALRLPGVLGKGDHTSWLSAVLKKAISNEDIEIYNSGSLFNNVIDVSGVAKFLKNVIACYCEGFDVITIAASEPVSVYEAVHQIITEVGSRSRIIEKHSDTNSFTISIDKAKRKYHFAPLSTRELIRRYVNLNARQKV
jgi:nucleoside-diphosphate-sugar epimerase